MDEKSSHEYCVEAVRRGDRDRYLTALYANAAGRAPLFALYAFNLELAQVRESVSEPMIGEIRLTWWRETLAALYEGQGRAHPVVAALANFIAAARPPQALFEEAIDGRLADIYESRPQSLDDLKAHAGKTGGALQQLAAWALVGRAPNPATLDAARAVGSAWTLSRLIAALGFQAAHAQGLLPEDLLRAARIDPDSLYQGELSGATGTVIRQIHAAAQQALDDARALRADVEKNALPALLPAALAARTLKKAAAADFDPAALAQDTGDLTRQARLFWAMLRGRY